MTVASRSEIVLTFGGTLSPRNTVSLRTLSYTIPHFQRAIDKTVYFSQVGEIRKYSALPPELHEYADLYIDHLETGSLKIPFLSDLLAGVPQLYADFMSQPYEYSALEVVVPGNLMAADLESSKVSAQLDNLEPITQEQLIASEGDRKSAFAQAAVLKDMSQALSVARTTPGAILNVGVNADRGRYEFEFDQLRAGRFGRYATTRRLSEPAMFVGRITGLEKQRATGQFQYAAKFLSRLTGQESKLLISDYDDALKIHPHNLNNQDIAIWAAPVSLHDSFDPVRGDIVFVDFATQL
ncbi:hypothetical protein K1T36_18210 [Pseudomonas protegens]|uniref:hypothetical protein n=1 Tax=Pseudomonas protegens TaxID=380021 RepID=UPI001C6A1D0D|nr:hypothetical protein [Pseudomonas protegens]QYM99028.1 hypothetical protein K1T36_18210 [Pseudomonas protegens]